MRGARRNKIKNALANPPENLDENKRVLIKKGPTSMQTSLKQLEENYAGKTEWKGIENGGVLSVPVEEFRMINHPKPDRSGNINFGNKKGRGGGNLIKSYTIAETVADLNEKVLNEYERQKENTQSALLHLHNVICLDIGVKHVHI